MKYIFYSLLMINLIYFAYEVFVSSNEKDSIKVDIEQELSKGDDQLTLLDEIEGTQKGKRNEALEKVVFNPVTVNPSDEVPAVTPAPVCKALGPFSDINEGQDMVDLLVALNLKVTLQAIDSTLEESDYRLMIQPAPSLQAAYSRHQQLKSGGIDSFVMTQGRYKYAVSLGVFSAEEAAEDAQDDLPDYGFPLEIVEIPRIGREYWVVPSEDPHWTISEAVWEVMADERPELRRQLMECID